MEGLPSGLHCTLRSPRGHHAPGSLLPSGVTAKGEVLWAAGSEPLLRPGVPQLPPPVRPRLASA